MGMVSNQMSIKVSYMLVFMVSFVSSDLGKDRDECASQLVGLATCLPYVSGTSKAPTLDCCTGLKQVIGKSRKCLCILVKDRNDPNLGLKINATLALGLPNTCHVPSNVSECPALLHLPPNSPEAQVFEQFAKSQKGSPPASNVGNSTSSSGGGRGKRWLGVEMVAWCFAAALVIIHVYINLQL